MRIVFMGTPEFAVAPLKTLIEKGYEIAAVITVPDKPSGRGKKIQSSAVKIFALSQGLKILQPEKLKSEDFIAELKDINPDLQIVVAFRMLPREVWEIPILGTFNLHASLLPDYRGAAPINHAVMNGDSITGLTTFFIDEKIDTGGIILQVKMNIGPDETAGELHDRMMNKGSELVLKTVKLIKNNKAATIPQSQLESGLQMRPAPKIFKEDCHISWDMPVLSIHNLIRGLSPYPGAFALLSGDGNTHNPIVKIFHSTPVIEKHDYSPGTIITDNKTYLKVSGTDGFIVIQEIQMAGKKRLSVNEFLRGYIFDETDYME